MALQTDFLIIVGTYVAVFVLATLVYNFLTTGFLRIYLLVKASRGAKVMVFVRTVSRIYHRAGFIEDGMLVYKDANKHEKRLSIPHDKVVFYRALNITCINVDEETNTIIKPAGQEVAGFDAEKYNNLYLRTLYRPSILDPKQQIMFFLIIIITLATVATVFLLMFSVGKNLNAVLANTEVLKTYFIGLNATII